MNCPVLCRKLYLTGALFLIFLNACQQPKNNGFNLNVVDLKGAHEEVTLNLEDFSNDIQLIQLETRDDILMNRFHGYVGKRYIISIDRDRILQFFADGTFIRTISRKGKGPDEFNQIDAWDVDEKEGYFYYHDKAKDYIKRYNLENFAFEDDIPFRDKGSLSGLIAVNDTLFAVLPDKFSKYGYLYFFQSASGKITGGKEKEPVPHPGAWAGRSDVFKKGADASIFYQPSESDTLYRITLSGIEPEIAFSLEKPEKNGSTTKGFHSSFLFKNGKKLFLNKTGFKSEVTQISASINILSMENYFYDAGNQEVKKIKSFLYNYKGLDIHVPQLNKNGPYLSVKNNNRFVIGYHAYAFKNLIKEQIEEGNAPASQRNSLQHMYNSISENDNPVLISGTFVNTD